MAQCLPSSQTFPHTRPSTTPSPPPPPSYRLPLPLSIKPVPPQHQYHLAINHTFSSSAAFISGPLQHSIKPVPPQSSTVPPLPYSDGCLHLSVLFSAQSSLFLLGPQLRLLFHTHMSHEQPLDMSKKRGLSPFVNGS